MLVRAFSEGLLVRCERERERVMEMREKDISLRFSLILIYSGVNVWLGL